MTIVMKNIVSKSQFKSQALEFLRQVESKKQPLVVTHLGKPVVKIVPYKDVSVLSSLKKTVTSYKDPTLPVGLKDWDLLK